MKFYPTKHIIFLTVAQKLTDLENFKEILLADIFKIQNFISSEFILKTLSNFYILEG
jgi:hypothetical protein